MVTITQDEYTDYTAVCVCGWALTVSSYDAAAIATVRHFKKHGLVIVNP